MEAGNVMDGSNNISVSIGLHDVIDRHGTDQKAILKKFGIQLSRRLKN